MPRDVRRPIFASRLESGIGGPIDRERACPLPGSACTAQPREPAQPHDPKARVRSLAPVDRNGLQRLPMRDAASASPALIPAWIRVNGASPDAAPDADPAAPRTDTPCTRGGALVNAWTPCRPASSCRFRRPASIGSRWHRPRPFVLFVSDRPAEIRVVRCDDRTHRIDLAPRGHLRERSARRDGVRTRLVRQEHLMDVTRFPCRLRHRLPCRSGSGHRPGVVRPRCRHWRRRPLRDHRRMRSVR